MKSLSKTANEAFAGGLQTARPDEGQECLEDVEVQEQIHNNDDDFSFFLANSPTVTLPPPNFSNINKLQSI